MTAARILAVDIGGTKIAVGLATEAGDLLHTSRAPTSECGDGDDLLAAVCRMIDRIMDEDGGSFCRLGLALPGAVDRGRGCLVAALTLPRLNFRDLRAYFQERYGVPVALDNDANAAALGEACFGAGVGARVMLYFTVSTGVGGGIVAGGRLFRGATGNAGEFGHQTVLPGGPRCDCGKHGCLEALVSGPAIARRARQRAAHGPGGLIALRAEDLSAAEVAARAAAGDPMARRVWEETGYYLGIGVANAIAAWSPDTVVLGGGVTRAGDLLFEPTRRSARRHTPPHLFDAVRILPAALGDDVGLLGAVALTLEGGDQAPVDRYADPG